jgi:hypothetical protein
MTFDEDRLVKQKRASEIEALSEEPVSLEEYARRFSTPPSDEDVAETMDLVRWFCARYPTAKERFAYIRRKHEEWTRNRPDRGHDPGS